MIISMQHNFTFFHNPKVGGTSVRATLEPFQDVRDTTWGEGFDEKGHPVDLAHLGVDEFSQLRPDLWEKVQKHQMYCLLRDPFGRFYSSVSEHAKMHGKTDTRFATGSQRKNILFETIERLKPFGQSDAVMGTYEFTHFKPQWIYATSHNPDVKIRAFPIAQIDQLFAEISLLTGDPIEAQTRNRRETLSLPGPLASLAAQRKFRALAQNIPGITALKNALRGRYSAPAKPQSELFELTDADRNEVEAFVAGFYAQDIALWSRVSSA